jgi:hypothetical protein
VDPVVELMVPQRSGEGRAVIRAVRAGRTVLINLELLDSAQGQRLGPLVLLVAPGWVRLVELLDAGERAGERR